MSPKCARLTCENRAWRYGHGHCRKHAVALGLVQQRVPAGDVRKHLLACLNAGATTTGIADATGVASSTVIRLANGNYDRVSPQVAARLLRAAPGDSRQVPAWRVARRVRSLRAAGWRSQVIAARCDLSPEFLRKLCADQYEWVSVANASPIFEMWRDNGDRVVSPAPMKIRRLGWPVPADWDDVDDPAEVETVEPYTAPSKQALTVPLTDEIASLVSEYQTTFPTALQAAESLDMSVRTLQRLRSGTSSRIRCAVLDRVTDRLEVTRPTAA